MVDGYEVTPNLLLRELLDMDNAMATAQLTTDEALMAYENFRARFRELHRYLKDGGQFPREWITRRNQYSPEQWRQM
jgi:hypothetical protein